MTGAGKAGAYVAALGGICVLLGGCGGGSSGALRAQEFTRKGNAICAAVLNQVRGFARPSSESQLTSYLSKALELAEGELSALKRLHPPSSAKTPFQDALSEEHGSASILREYENKLLAKQANASEFGPISKRLGAGSLQANANFIKAGLTECAT